MKASIVGLDKLIIKLENMEDADIGKALVKSCQVVETSAKRLAPVDTGQLRGSISHEVQGNEGVVYTNVEYAPYVEFGTGLFAVKGNGRKDRWSYQDAEGKWHSTIGQMPQPFMHPALEHNREQIIRIFRNEIRRSMKS